MPRKNILTEIANKAKREHVRAMLKRGLSKAEVARQLNVSRQAIQHLLTRK